MVVACKGGRLVGVGRARASTASVEGTLKKHDLTRDLQQGEQGEQGLKALTSTTKSPPDTTLRVPHLKCPENP